MRNCPGRHTPQRYGTSGQTDSFKGWGGVAIIGASKSAAGNGRVLLLRSAWTSPGIIEMDCYEGSAAYFAGPKHLQHRSVYNGVTVGWLNASFLQPIQSTAGDQVVHVYFRVD